MKSLILMALILFVSACAKPPASQTSQEQTGKGIRYGEQILFSERPQVGAWLYEVGEDLYQTLCTGTLIAPGTVLSAAHCFVNPVSEERIPPELLFFSTDFSGSRVGNTLNLPAEDLIGVQAVRIHSGWDHTIVTGPNDFAVAYLLEDGPAVTYPLLAGVSLGVGAQVEAIGFGQNENLVTGVKRRADLTVIQPFNGASYLLSVAPSSQDQMICPGDSGGPALSDAGGVLRILGVASFINLTVPSAPCLSAVQGNYMKIAGLEPWIEDARDYPANHPWTNPAYSVDVNGDGLVSIADTLDIITTLRSPGVRQLQASVDGLPPATPYYDTTRDGWVTIADVLEVVQYLRENGTTPIPIGSDF